MAPKPLPAQDVLLQLLSYDPETGKLFWKERGPEWFSSSQKRSASHAAANWNSRMSGKEASCSDASGYRRIAIFNQKFWAHRVVWKLMTGEDAAQIDHVNGVRSDNRIANLRNVSPQENNRNQKRHSHNTSGFVGVSRHQNGRWEAYIWVNSRKVVIGYEATAELAAALRKNAERKHGFHPNHGRAA